MGWLLNLRPGASPAPRPNPSLTVLYDGFRKRRHMILVAPGSEWGGRAYGLGDGDDYHFVPADPKKGQKATLHVNDRTLARLVRQRDLRFSRRRPRGIR